MPDFKETASANSDQSHDHHGPNDTQKAQRRKFAMTMLTGIFLALGLIYLLYWLIWGRFEIYTEDAYVGGNIVQLMPQVAGTVVEVNANDTERVFTGQPLVRLNTADTQIALQQAQALLADTVRKVRRYFENVQAAQAELILRQADLKKAQLDFKRRIGLVGEKAISREEFEHKSTSYTVAKAQYDLALHKYRGALALVENAHLYTHPMVERAKANLKNAYLNRQRTTIVAPVTGYVAKRNVQVGQQVDRRTPMLTIVPLNEVWVDANYKESQLSRIRIGQAVKLTADTYGDFEYHGKVLGLSPGTGSAFDLLPPQNATGNWIKIVQRLPVRILLDPNEFKKYPLRIGLSMRVKVDTYQLKGELLATVPNAKPHYVTHVYADELKQVNELIDKILKESAPDMYLPPSKAVPGAT